MATTFDSFLPYILPYARGVSDLAAYQALRDTAIDFCRRTLLVQRVSVQNVVAATQVYTPAVPTDMQLSRLIGVSWNSRWLTPIAAEDVESDTVLQGAAIGTNTLLTGSPVAYFQKTPTDLTFGLYPIPDTALTNGLTIKAAFLPSLTATNLEDVLFNEYAEGLAAGALARLMVMPNEPFTSPGSAPLYKAVYEAAVAEGKRSRGKGKTLANRRVRPVAWV